MKKINEDIKIKEYPPLISVMTIIKDRLVGAKSYATVIKRLKTLKVKIFKFQMVKTEELLDAILEDNNTTTTTILRKSKPFKLPKP